MSTGTYSTADPATVDADLDTRLGDLDENIKALDEASEELLAAEEAWDKLYDEVEEALKDEYIDLGRKSAPSEKAIESATRKQHRAAYTRYRRAKRELDRLEKKAQSIRAILGGRQTQAAGLREELRQGAFSR
jgi:chromosome segregation ATPase